MILCKLSTVTDTVARTTQQIQHQLMLYVVCFKLLFTNGTDLNKVTNELMLQKSVSFQIKNNILKQSLCLVRGFQSDPFK